MAAFNTRTLSTLSRASQRTLRNLSIHFDEQLEGLSDRLLLQLPDADQERIRALRCTESGVAKAGPKGIMQDPTRRQIGLVFEYPASGIKRLPALSSLPLLRRWQDCGLPMTQGDGQCGAFAVATALGLAHGMRSTETFPDPSWLYEMSGPDVPSRRGRTLQSLAEVIANGFIRSSERSANSVRRFLLLRMLRRPAMIRRVDDAQILLRLAADVCTGHIGSPIPIVVSLEIGENWTQDRSGILRRQDPTVEQQLGAHAAVVLGVTSIEGRGFVVIGNSWGEAFGGQASIGLARGVALMSFDHFAETFLSGLLIVPDPLDAWAIRRSASGKRSRWLGHLWYSIHSLGRFARHLSQHIAQLSREHFR